jgi:hypothetical protein
MIGLLPRILLGILLLLCAADAAILSCGHFLLDWVAYARFAAISSALACAGMVYSTVRKDERIAATLFGTAFLTAFSNMASVLNYFLLTVAGSPIDETLAHIDRAMGIDWPAMIAWAADHRRLNFILYLAYGCILPQIALLVVLLGWTRQIAKIYSFCFAIAFASAMAIGFWTVFPSFGAIAVYRLDPALIAGMPLALDPAYAHQLLQLLANGPGYISPTELKGLIGFPSFHAVLALLVTWYARDIKYVRWPIAALNLLVLLSTPIQGGHHVVDVLAGFAVAALAILAAEKAISIAAGRRMATFPQSLSQVDKPA